MFLRDKSTAILVILVLLLVAGGVWYAQRPAPETPPVASENGEQAVVNTNDGLSDGDVDTGDNENDEWRVYHNSKHNYTIKLPIGFENRSPYDTSLLEFNPTASTINAVRGNSEVIRLMSEKRFITTTKGPTDRYEDLLNNYQYETRKIGNNEFTLLDMNIDFVKFFAIANDIYLVEIEFTNIENFGIEKVLQSFQFGDR